MITTSDKEYKETKQIMLGNKSINPDFKELAAWIDKTFAVKTINIIYDFLKNLNGPRINICFESHVGVIQKVATFFLPKWPHLSLQSVHSVSLESGQLTDFKAF